MARSATYPFQWATEDGKRHSSFQKTLPGKKPEASRAGQISCMGQCYRQLSMNTPERTAFLPAVHVI
jgi:hypothetical protein